MRRRLAGTRIIPIAARSFASCMILTSAPVTRRGNLTMNDYDEAERNSTLHSTLVEFLIHSREPEIAAAILEGGVAQEWDKGEATIFVEIPPAGYPLVAATEKIQLILRNAMRQVVKGHFGLREDVEIEFRMKHSPCFAEDPGWVAEMKRLITQFKGSNQGLISELAAAREGRPIHTWNELKYATKSEISIAQELEKRQILFFPLAVAVRHETGQKWKDHREVDFLICHNGAWGILEVAFHPDRYEKDREKAHWFKKSGILCIEHYTAERCYKEAPKVVDEFLGILKQYEK
jgi:hypothetical protein